MKTPSLRLALLSAAFGLACAVPAFAADTLVLPTSNRPFDPSVRIISAADATAPVHFQVALRLRDMDKMDAAIASHRILTPAELEAAHLPTQSDHDAVIAWLKSTGLTIDAVTPSRLGISVSGSAANVSRALGVNFAHITSEGHDYIASSDAPKIPKNLENIVLGINGLQPQLHAHTMFHSMTPVHSLSATQPGVVPFGPADLKNAYTANGLGTGLGTTTAIVIDTFPLTSDLTAFWTMFNIPQSLSNITFIQTNPGTLPAQSGEESLDTEYSSSIAPSSKVRVYAAQSLANSALDTTFLAIISDMKGSGGNAPVKITQVTISLGECEASVPLAEAMTDDQDFATMTALGASVFVSSGDSGEHECFPKKTVSPSFYSTSPHVAAAGGTTLTMSGTKETKETAWSGANYLVGGSGGGISGIFAQPAYQKGLPYTKRTVPDLSTDANPSSGVLVIVGGSSEQVGGTSVSSPTMAALFGLVNANRIAAGKTTIGLLNTDIYPLVLTTNFRDITSGSNGYKCTKGYDLVTGIGAPLMATLGTTLQNLP